MSDLAVCRICLSDNVSMYWIVNTPMQDVFETLTNSKIQKMALPETFCYICYSLIKKCYSLAKLAQNSEQVLLNYYHSGIQLSPETLRSMHRQTLQYSVTHIESVSVGTEDETNKTVHVKKEEEECQQIQSIIEHSEKIEIEIGKSLNTIDQDLKQDTEILSDKDVSFEATDSEDEIPLQNIKKRTRRKESVRERKKTKKDRSCRREKEDTKIDAKEVILSKEQQMKDVLDRRKTTNYINSSYKCDLCYKGFMNSQTYNNHMFKHDLSCGPYQCDVCRLRYNTARNLKNHIYKSHSRYYRCNKCGHDSHTYDQAKDHEKWHEGVTFECKICFQDFKKRTSYLTHVRLMHPTEHVCNMCGHSFLGKNGLMLHKGKAHRDFENTENIDESLKTYCSECNIQFMCMEAIQRHILKSVKHKKWKETSSYIQCLVCDLQFPDKTSITKHIKEHKRKLLPKKMPEKPPPPIEARCTECDSVFTSEANLKAHVKTVHLGQKYDKNIVCEVCGKKCRSNAGLEYHQRAHTGERPYACPASGCSKRFAGSYQLRVHARTHSGERPYACRVCRKRFKQKTALNRHYLVHTGAKPFSCKLCSKTFSQSNSVKVHVDTVHLKLPSYRKRGRDNAGAGSKGDMIPHNQDN